MEGRNRRVAKPIGSKPKPIGSKPNPIRHYVKILLIITFSALVLDFIISIASIYIVKQQSTRYLQDTADLYINRFNHDFEYINRYMGLTLANDESVERMDTEGTDYGVFIKSNETLYNRFSELKKNYDQPYNFFLYLKNQNFFSNTAPMTLSYPEYRELKKLIVSYVEDKNVYEKFYSSWTPVLVKEKYYIINIVPYYDRYLICLIAADDLIRPLRQIDLGENGYASLVDRNGKTISSSTSNSGEAQPINTSMASRTTTSRAFPNASFSVLMVIKFGTFEKIMIAQLLIMLLFLLIAFTLSAVMLYFKNRVLKPIQSFSENLSLFNENSETLDFKSSKIFELEQANTQFIHLVEQIKKFKIDIYEQELEKQRIQLDYMKLQIKPHFFLNILTNIYSMAQMQMYKEIENMTMFTSTYFRYIFQSGQDFARLEDELEHVRIYLEIQKHRYRNAFSYRIERTSNEEDVRIPPLVLQSFIENSVKYAISGENEVNIALTVNRSLEEGEEKIVIRISDTGPGFAADILEKLTNGEPMDQSEGTRIGIMNTLQRLELLYSQTAKVTFSNREEGGACVTIYLPISAKEET
jgi:two-component system sensor histidine kinase YesM